MVFEVCEKFVNGSFEGNISEFISQCPFASSFTGGLVGGAISGAIIAIGIMFIMLIWAAFYVYSSLAWYAIAKKLKNKNAWVSWIPIVRIGLILQLGEFHWAWVFLILIPILGWIALFVLFIIATWRIFKKRKYPGWFSLAVIIPEVGGVLHLIAIGFAAWGKKK